MDLEELVLPLCPLAHSWKPVVSILFTITLIPDRSCIFWGLWLLEMIHEVYALMHRFNFSHQTSFTINFASLGSQASQQMKLTKQFIKWLSTMEHIHLLLVMVGFQRVYAHQWMSAFAMESQIHESLRFVILNHWCLNNNTFLCW